jgi:hypothetical protein
VELLNRHLDWSGAWRPGSRLEDTFGMASAIEIPIDYTGLMAASPPAPPAKFPGARFGRRRAAGASWCRHGRGGAPTPDVSNWALITG